MGADAVAVDVVAASYGRGHVDDQFPMAGGGVGDGIELGPGAVRRDLGIVVGRGGRVARSRGD